MTRIHLSTNGLPYTPDRGKKDMQIELMDFRYIETHYANYLELHLS